MVALLILYSALVSAGFPLTYITQSENITLQLGRSFNGKNITYSLQTNASYAKIYQDYILSAHPLNLSSNDYIITSLLFWSDANLWYLISTYNAQIILYYLDIPSDTLTLTSHWDIDEGMKCNKSELIDDDGMESCIFFCGKSSLEAVYLMETPSMKIKKYKIDCLVSLPLSDIYVASDTNFLYRYDNDESSIKVYLQYWEKESILELVELNAKVEEIDFNRELHVSYMNMIDYESLFLLDSYGYLSIIYFTEYYQSFYIVSDNSYSANFSSGKIILEEDALMILYDNNTFVINFNLTDLYNPQIQYLITTNESFTNIGGFNNHDILAISANYVAHVMHDPNNCFVRFDIRFSNEYNHAEKDIAFDNSYCRLNLIQLKTARFYDDIFTISTGKIVYIVSAFHPYIALYGNKFSSSNIQSYQLNIHAYTSTTAESSLLNIIYAPLALENFIFSFPHYPTYYVDMHKSCQLPSQLLYRGNNATILPITPTKYYDAMVIPIKQISMYQFMLPYKTNRKLFYSDFFINSTKIIVLKSGFINSLDVFKVFRNGEYQNLSINDSGPFVPYNFTLLSGDCSSNTLETIYGMYTFTNSDSQYIGIAQFTEQSDYRMQVIYSSPITIDILNQYQNFMLIYDNPTGNIFFTYNSAKEDKGNIQFFFINGSNITSIGEHEFNSRIISVYSLNAYLLIIVTRNKLNAFETEWNNPLRLMATINAPADDEIIGSVGYQNTVYMITKKQIISYAFLPFPYITSMGGYILEGNLTYWNSPSGYAIVSHYNNYIFALAFDGQNFWVIKIDMLQTAIQQYQAKFCIGSNVPKAIHFAPGIIDSQMFIDYGNYMQAFSINNDQLLYIDLKGTMGNLTNISIPITISSEINQISISLNVQTTLSSDQYDLMYAKNKIKYHSKEFDMYQIQYVNPDNCITNNPHFYIQNGYLCSVIYNPFVSTSQFSQIARKNNVLGAIVGSHLSIYYLKFNPKCPNNTSIYPDLDVDLFSQWNIYPIKIIMASQGYVYIYGTFMQDDMTPINRVIAKFNLTRNDIRLIIAQVTPVIAAEMVLSQNETYLFLMQYPSVNYYQSDNVVFNYIRQYDVSDNQINYIKGIGPYIFDNFNIGDLMVTTMCISPQYPSLLFMGTSNAYILIYDINKMESYSVIDLGKLMSPEPMIVGMKGAGEYIFVVTDSQGVLLVDPRKPITELSMHQSFSSPVSKNFEYTNLMSEFENDETNCSYISILIKLKSNPLTSIIQNYIVSNSSLYAIGMRLSSNYDDIIHFFDGNYSTMASYILMNSTSLVQHYLYLDPEIVMNKTPQSFISIVNLTCNNMNGFTIQLYYHNIKFTVMIITVLSGIILFIVAAVILIVCICRHKKRNAQKEHDEKINSKRHSKLRVYYYKLNTYILRKYSITFCYRTLLPFIYAHFGQGSSACGALQFLFKPLLKALLVKIVVAWGFHIY